MVEVAMRNKDEIGVGWHLFTHLLGAVGVLEPWIHIDYVGLVVNFCFNAEGSMSEPLDLHHIKPSFETIYQKNK